MEKKAYEKLFWIRVATVVILGVLTMSISIPLDLIAMLVGLWVMTPTVRTVILVLEVLNLLIAVLSLMTGNLLGSMIGIGISAYFLYSLNQHEIKMYFND